MNKFLFLLLFLSFNIYGQSPWSKVRIPTEFKSAKVTDSLVFEGPLNIKSNVKLENTALTNGQSLISNGTKMVSFTPVSTQSLYTVIKAREDSVFGLVDINDGGSGEDILVSQNSATALINDGLGAFTDFSHAPTAIAELENIWNSTTNSFDFSKLPIGSSVTIRVDIEVTTTANNQTVEVYGLFGINSVSPYEINFSELTFKSTGTYKMVSNNLIYIGNTLTKTNPAKVIVLTDANATVKVNGFLLDLRLTYD